MSEKTTGEGSVSGTAVVVTGASSGIGAACVRELSRSGYTVFAGRRDVLATEAATPAGPGDVIPLALDVTDDESVALARDTVDRLLGPGGRLAGLVNNAGTVFIGPAELLRMEDLREQYEVNVIGAVRVSQAFLPALRRSGGRVVNMGSLTARVSFPFAGPYSSSKAALAAITHSMRRELEHLGVRVALVEPGNVNTGIWDKHVRSVEALCSQGRSRTRGGPTSELCGRTSRWFAGCGPEAPIPGAWRGRSSTFSTQRTQEPLPGRPGRQDILRGAEVRPHRRLRSPRRPVHGIAVTALRDTCTVAETGWCVPVEGHGAPQRNSDRLRVRKRCRLRLTTLSGLYSL